MAGSLYLGSQRVCPAIVSGSGSDSYFGFNVDQSGKLTFQKTGDIVFSGFSDVGSYVFDSMFSNCSITSVDLSNLTTINGNLPCSEMFYGCESLTSADLRNLTTIRGNSACGNMFSVCSSLSSVDLSKVETIKGSNTCSRMFSYCSSLTSLSFPSLKIISGSTVFASILQGCSGVTIHFPSNMESTISGLASYPNFGGNNTKLLFDLPPTA